LLEEEGGVTFDAFVLGNAKWIWSKVMDAKDTSGSLMFIQRGEDLPLAQFFFEMSPVSLSTFVRRNANCLLVEP